MNRHDATVRHIRLSRKQKEQVKGSSIIKKIMICSMVLASVWISSNIYIMIKWYLGHDPTHFGKSSFKSNVLSSSAYKTSHDVHNTVLKQANVHSLPGMQKDDEHGKEKIDNSQPNKKMDYSSQNSSPGKPLQLGPTYTNPEVLKNGCSLTILWMDPRLAIMTKHRYQPLESFLANVYHLETTCILLQTSVCMKEANVLDAVYQLIIKKALSTDSMPLPYLRQQIERGNVRVSIIDHNKYKLPSCDNFEPPNMAMMHIEYWGPAEYTPQDSDTVLILQDDVTCCQPLDIDRWRDVAYVGAPWPPQANLHNNPIPEEGACRFISEKWGNFTRPHLGHEQKWRNGDFYLYRPPAPEPIVPSYPLDVVDVTKLPQMTPEEVCDGAVTYKGALGNGGLTIRSRKWLRRAIASCPHVQWSGLAINPHCAVYANLPEDLYFATILRGLRAPLPTAFEASLFSVEMMLPQKVAEYYGPPDEEGRIKMVTKRWADRPGGETALERYERMKKEGVVISIGWHKPWWYHNTDFLLNSAQMRKECAYAERAMSLPIKREKLRVQQEEIYRQKVKEKAEYDQMMAQQNFFPRKKKNNAVVNKKNAPDGKKVLIRARDGRSKKTKEVVPLVSDELKNVPFKKKAFKSVKAAQRTLQ